MPISSSSSKLKALLRKNITIMFRNCCSLIAEILFPIILMLIIWGIRQAFKVETHTFASEEIDDDTFFKNRSVSHLDKDSYSNSIINNEGKWNDIIISRNILEICYNASDGIIRPLIATVNVDNIIKNKIKDYTTVNESSFEFVFQDFENVESIEKYISSNEYGQDDEHSRLCFGISFSSNENSKYEYALHYFDSSLEGSIKDISDGKSEINDPFQEVTDMGSYNCYVHKCYNQIHKFIAEYIISKEKGNINDNYHINFGIMAMKYDKFKTDPFGFFVGYIVPFFIVIAICVLFVYIFLELLEKKKLKLKKV